MTGYVIKALIALGTAGMIGGLIWNAWTSPEFTDPESLGLTGGILLVAGLVGMGARVLSDLD